VDECKPLAAGAARRGVTAAPDRRVQGARVQEVRYGGARPRTPPALFARAVAYQCARAQLHSQRNGQARKEAGEEEVVWWVSSYGYTGTLELHEQT